VTARMTLREFADDIQRRVFRLDSAMLHTFKRALLSPGALASDYLAGRRRGILDPVHYYVSAVFLQFLIVALTRALAPLMDRMSALNWLGVIGGIVATRIVTVFVMGGIWQLLFRSREYNLAETYVFALYAFGTVGILWATLPLFDLVLPIALGDSPRFVVSVCLLLEMSYIIFGIRQFGRFSAFGATWRVLLVFGIVYAAVYTVGGYTGWHQYVLPPLPRA
jgi:hypothetical protein